SIETFLARFSVSVGVLCAPGIFLMIILPSGPFSFSSVTSISDVNPPTSVNCAMVVPSISIAKLRAAIASLLETFGTPAAIYPSLFAERCAARELGDLEDDELCRFHRGDADLDDELARIDRSQAATAISREKSILSSASSSTARPTKNSLFTGRTTEI